MPTLPTIRHGLRLLLLTMMRKGELQDATWDEVDFENAVWTICKERMKGGKPHNVYLSRQTLDIMIALKTCAGVAMANSPVKLPDGPRTHDSIQFQNRDGTMIKVARSGSAKRSARIVASFTNLTYSWRCEID